MSVAAPSSLSLAQKKRLWEEYKYDTYEKISQNKSEIFNYFMINNDIFGMIDPNDEIQFKLMQLMHEDEKSNVFFGTIAAVFLVDQVLLRLALPKFKLTNWRLTINTFKYLGLPCLTYSLYKQHCMQEYVEYFYNIQQKYGFDFHDYMNANRIFERALAVNRLEQLREKRSQFDWTGIPELPQGKAAP